MRHAYIPLLGRKLSTWELEGREPFGLQLPGWSPPLELGREVIVWLRYHRLTVLTTDLLE